MGELGLLVVAATLTYAGVAAIRRWAERHDVLDRPNERSSHTRPTPRWGGLAIAVTVLIGLAVVARAAGWDPGRPGVAYVAGGALVALISGIDDLRSLSSLARLGAHAIVAAVTILGVGHWSVVDVPGLGPIELGAAGIPLTFVWLLGLTNAYNFMDGIDGIAAGQGVVAGVAWAVIGTVAGQPIIATLGVLLAGASLGFLGHNWPPARIFMGDVGSAFLGYSFAALPLLLARLSPDPRLDRLSPWLGCLVVWPFVADASVTFLRRLARGENVLAAHRSHVYQRLVIGGQSHRRVTSLYVLLAVVGALVAVLLAARPGPA